MTKSHNKTVKTNALNPGINIQASTNIQASPLNASKMALSFDPLPRPICLWLCTFHTTRSAGADWPSGVESGRSNYQLSILFPNCTGSSRGRFGWPCGSMGRPGRRWSKKWCRYHVNDSAMRVQRFTSFRPGSGCCQVSSVSGKARAWASAAAIRAWPSAFT